ncbi:MAG: SpoIIE family protein phosphatase [Eggerthellaceae bacterium]|nr:SpoIIE family protein phosphatase [Eggerthellaceae bacterium]
MPADTVKARKKKPILRWRGVLAGSYRTMRQIVAIVLAVAGASLAFVQMGFVDLSLPDGTVGYAVVLLVIVALGSLLLGSLPGAALGLVIGCVLYLHAQFLPLDHYELSFVTPATSIVMFGICGLLFGVLFAFALRNNPSRIRRIVYITIICFAVSMFYSFGFFVNMVVSLAINISETVGPDTTDPQVQKMATAAAAQLGDMGVQVWATAIMAALLCCIGDFATCKAQERKSTLGLRAVFGSRLAVAVALTFMVTAAMGFAVITVNELRSAESQMEGEVDYLINQFGVSDKQVVMVDDLLGQANFDYDALDEDVFNSIVNLFSDDVILDGYDAESDGIVIVAVDGTVYASNDEHFARLDNIEDIAGHEMLNAVDRSVESGRMQRFVFYIVTDEQAQESDPFAGITSPHIAYLVAKKMSTPLDGDSTYDRTVVMVRPSSLVFASRGSVMAWTTLSAAVLFLAVFVMIFQLLNRVVARPIDEENKALALITAGKLDTRAEAGGTREFESLSDGINTTVGTLKGWITEAESRMDAELATARAIQEAALPRTFPPFPEVLKFDIYASMNAAREVGGDFYDFFLVGNDSSATEGKLGFVVADVSGKGVPAALFMMKAKALLRDYVGSGVELGEAVTEVNRQLLDGNDAGMFVTAWVGVLDYATRHVDYVNAGHNPPLLWQSEGGWRWLRQKSGPILGLFELPYRALSVDCRAGDTFLLYTDGVTEAYDVDEQLYGEERLLAIAEEGYRLHPRELLESVRSDVAAYAYGAVQSDDITLLTLEVGVPPETTAMIEVPAQIAELNRVNDFLHAELDRRLCPKRAQNQLDIAVEELFVNVCNYAYPDSTPESSRVVRVLRTYSADPPCVTVDIVDFGVPFDPLAKPDAVTPRNIEDVPIGGLGILMAKKSVDDIRYERVGNSNVVTIEKRW